MTDHFANLKTHHFADSGLQTHSVGPLYPWSVVVYKGRKSGYCRLENLVTGEKLDSHLFDSMGDFISAHRAAENDYPKPQPVENFA